MRCVRCKEELEEGFDICWNCGADSTGSIDVEFRHADAPIESDTSVLEAIGAITGVYRKESKPWFKWDRVVPRWMLTIFIGVVILVVATFLTDGKDFGEQLAIYLVGAVVIVGGLLGAYIGRQTTDELAVDEESFNRGPNQNQRVFDFIIEVKLGSVPDAVLQNQLVTAFEINARHSESLIKNVAYVASQIKKNDSTSPAKPGTISAIALQAFSEQPDLLSLFD